MFVVEKNLVRLRWAVAIDPELHDPVNAVFDEIWANRSESLENLLKWLRAMSVPNAMHDNGLHLIVPDFVV